MALGHPADDREAEAGKHIQSIWRAAFSRACAGERGIGEGLANTIFDAVAKFASYGFNKSHAAAYALLAYHTAVQKGTDVDQPRNLAKSVTVE